MNPTTIEAITRLAIQLETQAEALVIDADTHVTDPASLAGTTRERFETTQNYYHGRPISAEDLVRELDMAEVDMALIWQNPAATPYIGDPESNTQALWAANRYVKQSAERYPDRLIPAGWVDPRACGGDNALAMVRSLIVDYGFFVVKMNPAQNQYPIDSPEVLALVDAIVELGAVPAFHFGADTEFTPAEGLRQVAARHPGHPLLAVHMGGGGAGYVAAESLYAAARRLGLECPDIHYVLSAKRETHIESDLVTYQMAGEPFCHHLFCASDAPYGRIAWNFGGFRAMFRSLADGARHTDPRMQEHPGLFPPEAVQNYLGGNFARFAAAGCRRLLATHQP